MFTAIRKAGGKANGADRLTFLVAIFGVLLSGTAVLAIHNSTENLQRKRVDLLTKGLWKFVPESEMTELLVRRRWQWRVLLMAGVMLAATVIAMTVMTLGHQTSLCVGGVVFLVWLAGILVFWYYWVISPKSKRERSKTLGKSEEGSPALKGWQRKVKNEADHRLPVTIITGFLGSGKTTLVKRILHNTVGMKVLVIENEIGTEGIDHALLMQNTSKEEIVLMNNGCICCTVRQDMLKMFHRLFENDTFSQLDWVVIETTGLADPAPLIQSLYIDDKCNTRMRLDGVVTVVDCLHFLSHAVNDGASSSTKDNTTKLPPTANPKTVGAHGGLSEARLQVAFADRVLLNKADLVSSGGGGGGGGVTLNAVAEKVRSINNHAAVFVCEQSNVPIDELINIRAFDASRNEQLLRDLRQQSGYKGLGEEDRPILIQRDATGKIVPKSVKFNYGANKREGSGTSQTDSSAPIGGVCTLSLTSDDPLDLNQFNEWISSVLRDHGESLYRLKGILSMRGYDEQFVAQGVHMIFDGELGPQWTEDTKRTSTLVLIGLGLPVVRLKNGWDACRADKAKV